MFKKVPDAPQFRDWKLHMRTQVLAATDRPRECLPWIWAVENSTVEQLADAEHDFITLDFKLLAAVVDAVSPVMKRDIRLWEERRLQENPPGIFSGRQALRLVYDHFEPDRAQGQLFDFQHLEAVRMNGNDLRSFWQQWDHVIIGVPPPPAGS